MICRHPASVLCYSFEEVFEEKIRAMGDRSRPRDLYDIITPVQEQGYASLPGDRSLRV